MTETRTLDPDLGPHVASHVLEGQKLPLFIEPLDKPFEAAADVSNWIGNHRAEIDRLVTQYGAVVLRGFPIASTADFNEVVGNFPIYIGGYQGGAASRRKVDGNVYEATQLAGHKRIELHQEMYYVKDYPARIAFYALKVAERGGETFIGDMRRLTELLPRPMVERLRAKGVRNVRNFGPPTGSDVETEVLDRRGWDFAFYTDSKAEVEEVCRRREMEPLWNEDNSLTVFNVVPGLATHPATGEEIYRSGLHGARSYRVGPEAGSAEAEVRARQKNPTGVFLGDGSNLSEEEETLLAKAVEEVTIAWDWQPGDLMILDNLAVGHGRNPFEGDRETLVAMLD